MKKQFIALLFILTTAFALADPPKNIAIKYNKGSNKAKIVVNHMVSDVESHFIKEIDIMVDTALVKKIYFKRQFFINTQEIEQVLPTANSGSVIKVKAICNQYGSKTTSYTIK